MIASRGELGGTSD